MCVLSGTVGLSMMCYTLEKAMGGIELLVVFTVTALNLTIVAGCIWPDEFVLDSQALELQFKERRRVVAFWHHTIGKFTTVVRLATLNAKGEFLYHMAQKHSG